MADSKYQLALQIVGMVDASLGKSVQMTKKQMRDLAKAAAQASGQAVSVNEAFSKASPGIDTMWGGMTKAAGTAVNAAKLAAGAVTALGSASTMVGADFESSMSSWAATAQATKEEYVAAKAAAMEMGRSTSKTASESANALEYMALAGWSVEKSIKGLPSVLKLSEATALELATTSDLVTDSMSATGVEVDNLSHYLDVVAMANNKSNQTAQQLMEAYISVGGTMKNLNVPIEESATVLGMLANRGIKGSEAGNALNAVINNMTTRFGKAGKMMDKLGLSAFDSEGKFKGLKQTFLELNERLEGMSEEERNLALASLGGKEHTDALNDIMQGLTTTLADGRTEWDALADSLNNCNGALERMADTKLDNLQGDFAKATSAMQDDAIRMYDVFKEPMREAVQEGTKWIGDFGKVAEETFTEKLPTIRRELLDGKDALTEFTEPAIATAKFLAENGDKVVGAIVGIGTAITTLKVAKEVTTGLAGIQGFIAAMASNPVTAAIGGVALLGGAVAGILAQEKIAAKQAAKNNLAKHFGDITLSLEDLKDVSKSILGAELFENLTASMEEMEKLGTISDKLTDASKKINRITWKIGAGFSLTDTDSADLKTSIDTMVNESLAAIEQARYTAHVSVTALFGQGNEKGEKILSELNGMYESINGEVQALGEQLGKAYNDAMEDGILDTDEAMLIQRLQEQLATITNEVSQAQSKAKLERIKLEYSGKELDPETFQNLQREINDTVQKMADDARTSHQFQLGALEIKFGRGEIDQESFDAAKKDIDDALMERLGELNQTSFDYSMDTIMESYKGEVDAFAEKVPGILEEAIGKMQGGTFGLDAFSGTDLQNAFGVDRATQDAVKQLLDGMEPQISEMKAKAEEYREAGKAIPETLQEGLNEVAALEALSGDFDAMYEVLGKAAAENSEYQSALDTLREQGAEIPVTLGESMTSHKDELDRAARQLRVDAATSLDSEFSSPFSVTADVNVNFRPISTIIGAEATSKTGIKKHASGGIVRSPELSWIGEGGDDEGIIPINRSQRAAELYNQVGQELAAAGNTGIGATGGAANVTYAPVFQISGSANESDLRKVTAESYQQFKSYMQRFMRDNVRLSY